MGAKGTKSHWAVKRTIKCLKCGEIVIGNIAWNRKYCSKCSNDLRLSIMRRWYARIGKIKKGPYNSVKQYGENGKERKIKHSHYGRYLARTVWDKYNERCARCGNGDWRVLNIHHLNGNNTPKDCILLCANCHAIIHYEEKENANSKT